MISALEVNHADMKSVVKRYAFIAGIIALKVLGKKARNSAWRVFWMIMNSPMAVFMAQLTCRVMHVTGSSDLSANTKLLNSIHENPLNYLPELLHQYAEVMNTDAFRYELREAWGTFVTER